MENIEIKKVSLQDTKFLFELMNNPLVLARLNEVPTTENDWVNAVLAWEKDPDENGYIIWKDGKRVGWFAFNGLLSADRIPWLKMAVILPEYHNQGIGTLVLTKLLKGIQEKGFHSVKLLTNQDNLKAQKCYQNCGFQIIAVIEDEMSDGTRAMRCTMECKI
mgnify:CR=1 FL=1